MAEDEELQVLGGVAAGEQHEQLDGATPRNVGEFESTRVTSRVGGKRATLPSHDRREPAAHRLRPSLRTPQPTNQRLAVAFDELALAI
jgi:hypothetical protein